MRIAILGAGVIGVTSAWELLRDGHEVTVFERHADAASECSFANAGMIAPGHAYPWASPRAPKILLKSLYDRTQALRFRPNLDPWMWRWCLQFLRNCSVEAVSVNARRKVRLCRYSQDRTRQVAEEAGIDYAAVRAGLLYLYRDPAHFELASRNKRLLTDQGLTIDTLEPADVAKLDPAYRDAVGVLAGALYCPSDESGDARVFTRALRRACEARGARFRFGTTVTALERSGSRVTGVRVGEEVARFDLVMVCLGAEAGRFLRRVGVYAPVYPIKGYSLTLPTAGAAAPVRIGAVDEGNLVAFAPMSDGLRITATAEFAGYDTSHRPRDFEHMAAVVRQLLPQGADHDRPAYWACLRPMTPEGTPLYGPTALEGLHVNVGQGHMGWTMACGSARIAADLVARRRPAIDTEGMLLLPGAASAARADTEESAHVH